MFLPGVSFAIGWWFHVTFPSWPFWVEGLSPLGAFGLLYTFFERAAWHWPVFRWLGVTTVPDLRGRWEGVQLSSFRASNGKPVESRIVLEATQTFGSVTTTTYFYRWHDAHSASSFLEIEGSLYLIIIFESEPGVHHSGPGQANKGVTRLQYLPDQKILTGTYFSTSGGYGEITLKRKSKKLLHRFAT